MVRFLSSGQAVSFDPIDISLGSAAELAAWSYANGHTFGSGLVKQWANQVNLLKRCMDILEGSESNLGVVDYTPRSKDFYPVRSPDDVLVDNQSWEIFLSRFASGLLKAEFKKLSHAVAEALAEMARNIVDHSTFAHPERSINGFAAYVIAPRQFTFTVADTGIGALESLRSNPRWNEISSSREALHHIARNHASRRTGQGSGCGYKELFVALSSFNGVVRIRSGTGIFSMNGALDKCAPTGGNGPAIAGLQLSIECRL